MIDQTELPSSTPLVNSVIHATRILDLYASQRKEYLSVTEISQTLGMHKTTVYRILRTLQSVGWIEQSEQNGRYRLGRGILMVASAVAVHHPTRELIAGEMRRLLDLHNETVVLSAVRGKNGICVDMVKSRHSLSVNTENGYIVPFDRGATGKTLLSIQPQRFVDDFLSTLEPEAAEALAEQLRVIREKGYCTSEGEVDMGVAAVAVPLPLKDTAYVLSISGPIERLRGLGYETLYASLAKASEAIQKMSDSVIG